MHLSRPARALLAFVALVVLMFLYAPLVIILVQSFNRSESAQWPPSGFTLQWWSKALDNTSWQDALWMSLKVATVATVIALVLGTLASFAVQRFEFFGRETISFIIVLPIALPGIVTGMALLSAIEYLNITPSLWTVVAGHATFCIVVVYNNAVARLRRTSVSFEEASMDLGADGWQTFRYVTLPNLSTALVAGGLLAFALSFDEVVVTLFTAGSQQTLPLWMYEQFKLPNTAPEANAVAVFVIALTALPIYFAQRLMRDTGGITGR